MIHLKERTKRAPTTPLPCDAPAAALFNLALFEDNATVPGVCKIVPPLLLPDPPPARWRGHVAPRAPEDGDDDVDAVVGASGVERRPALAVAARGVRAVLSGRGGSVGECSPVRRMDPGSILHRPRVDPGFDPGSTLTTPLRDPGSRPRIETPDGPEVDPRSTASRPEINSQIDLRSTRITPNTPQIHPPRIDPGATRPLIGLGSTHDRPLGRRGSRGRHPRNAKEGDCRQAGVHGIVCTLPRAPQPSRFEARLHRF